MPPAADLPADGATDADAAPQPASEDATGAERPLVEIGWVVAGRLDKADLRAVKRARALLLDDLRAWFPGFGWRMPVVRRRELVTNGQAEPVVLLDHGVLERDARWWDFALVVTEAPLQSYYKPFTLGAPSRAIGVAVLSTARLDPAALGNLDEADRVQAMTRRIRALALHLFGHLTDVDHADAQASFMYDVRTVADLDAMERFDAHELAELNDALADVADLRLEETGNYRGRELLFFLRAAALNAGAILSAIADVKPWQFPLRFSRLTTAAVSTLLVLIITAEAWDLGMSQPTWLVASLSVVALLGTSGFVIRKQNLLVRRRKGRLSEQRVVANVSIVASILLGMATTYGMLFAVTLAVSRLLFSRRLATSWAASLDGVLTAGHYLTLAAFVAALGIIIGALGASFEAQTYFRHVAFVDEET